MPDRETTKRKAHIYADLQVDANKRELLQAVVFSVALESCVALILPSSYRLILEGKL